MGLLHDHSAVVSTSWALVSDFYMEKEKNLLRVQGSKVTAAKQLTERKPCGASSSHASEGAARPFQMVLLVECNHTTCSGRSNF